MTDTIPTIDIDAEIAKLGDTELVSKQEVVDLLLDLRLEGVNPSAIDAILSSVPGKSLVKNSWVVEALEGLRNLRN